MVINHIHKQLSVKSAILVIKVSLPDLLFSTNSN